MKPTLAKDVPYEPSINISKRMLMLRQFRNLSQEYVAKHTPCDLQEYQEIEACKIAVSAMMLSKICGVLSVDIEDIATNRPSLVTFLELPETYAQELLLVRAKQ